MNEDAYLEIGHSTDEVLMNIFFSGIDKASAGITDEEILENDHDFFDDITDPGAGASSAVQSPAGKSATTPIGTPRLVPTSETASSDSIPPVNLTGMDTDAQSLPPDLRGISSTIKTTAGIKRNRSFKLKAIKRAKNRIRFPHRRRVPETKETSLLSNEQLHRLVLIRQLEAFKEMRELKEKEIEVLKEIKLSVDKLSGNNT